MHRSAHSILVCVLVASSGLLAGSGGCTLGTEGDGVGASAGMGGITKDASVDGASGGSGGGVNGGNGGTSAKGGAGGKDAGTGGTGGAGAGGTATGGTGTGGIATGGTGTGGIATGGTGTGGTATGGTGTGGTATGGTGTGGTATGGTGTGGTATGGTGTGGTATGGTGTGGTATGGTGTGGGVAGTGGSTLTEDCTNGKDDDQDGKIDCADGDCNGYGCQPATAVGYSLPGYTIVRKSTESPPDCGPLLTLANTKLLKNIKGDPYTCKCQCDEPTGGMCKAEASYHGDSQCQSAGVPLYPGCTPVSSGSNGSVDTEKPTIQTKGHCNASVNATVTPAVEWEVVYFCVATSAGGGCANGQVCIPDRPDGFSDKACIYLNSIAGCPPGSPYSKLGTYGTGYYDNRGCTSGCLCDEAAQQVCAGTVSLHDSSACTTPSSSVYQLDGACHVTGAPFGVSHVRLDLDPPTGGSCAIQGSASPSGAVNSTGLDYLCCEP